MTRKLLGLAIECVGLLLIGWAVAGWRGIVFALGVELISVAVQTRIRGGDE